MGPQQKLWKESVLARAYIIIQRNCPAVRNSVLLLHVLALAHPLLLLPMSQRLP